MQRSPGLLPGHSTRQGIVCVGGRQGDGRGNWSLRFEEGKHAERKSEGLPKFDPPRPTNLLQEHLRRLGCGCPGLSMAAKIEEGGRSPGVGPGQVAAECPLAFLHQLPAKFHGVRVSLQRLLAGERTVPTLATGLGVKPRIGLWLALQAPRIVPGQS
jgi:hypothetical protein